MKFSSFIHLCLLAYIIAALSFWWLSLEKQSKLIYQNEVAALNEHIDSSTSPLQYDTALHLLDQRKQMRSKQYMGEGITFLLIILIGSSIVYTTYKLNHRLAKQQQNFMLSVTHELKSPVAAIKLSIQTLLRHQNLDIEKRNALLSKCVLESDRLNELCNNVLIASQMEGGQYKPHKSLTNLNLLMQQTYENYNLRYPKRFELLPSTANIQLETDTTLLQLALHNVLDNALKYTQEHSKIQLELKETHHLIQLFIADEGPGIPDKEKKKIFQQFYRGGDEATRKTKGTGMGLYLTKKIMQSLNGNILVSNRSNAQQGSIFELRLKK